MDEVSIPVAEYLKFDVPGTLDEFLEVNGGVVESVLRFRARVAISGLEIGLPGNTAKAFPASARRSLQHDRKTDFGSDAAHFFQRLEVAIGAGNNGQAGLDERVSCRCLRAHQLHGGHRRADKSDAGSGAGAREIGVLSQKSVAGMD